MASFSHKSLPRIRKTVGARQKIVGIRHRMCYINFFELITLIITEILLSFSAYRFVVNGSN